MSNETLKLACATYSDLTPSLPPFLSSLAPSLPCPLTCLAASLTRLCHRSSLTYLLEDLFRHHLRLRKKDAAPAVAPGLPVVDKFRVTNYFILGTISPAEHTLKVRSKRNTSCTHLLRERQRSIDRFYKLECQA
jgi:hypothetical protein